MMKKILLPIAVLVILLVVLLIGNNKPEIESPDTTTEVQQVNTGSAIPVGSALCRSDTGQSYASSDDITRYYPYAATDRSSQEITAELQSIIDARDVTRLTDRLGGEVFTAFDTKGTQGFLDYWALRDTPQQSNLWAVMQELIDHGFHQKTWPDGTQVYVAPVLFSDIMDHVQVADQYTTGHITRSDAAIYQRPDAGSRQLADAGCAVVTVPDRLQYGQSDWIEVVLSDGTSGYVAQGAIRLLRDYQMTIESTGDQWEIVILTSSL